MAGYRESVPKDNILVMFNSAKRTAGCSTSFSTTLNNPITRVRKIEFVSAEIPATYYVFNDGNLALCKIAGVEIVMTPGSYTLAGMIAMVNGLAGMSGVVLSQNAAGKLVFSIPTLTTLVINLNKSDTSASYHRGAQVLGFCTTTSMPSVVPTSSVVADLVMRTTNFVFVNNNRSLAFTITVGGVPTTYVCYITAGNYTAATLCTELQTRIAAVIPNIATTTVTYSSITYKFTIAFTVSVAFQSAVLVYGTTSATNAAIVSTASGPLGITANLSAGAGTAFSNVCQNPGNVSGIPYFYIKSFALSSKRQTKTFSSQSYEDTVHKIVVNVNPGDIISDQAEYRNQIFMASNTTFTSIDLRLEDEDGILLDLNGLDWSVGMIFEIM
jgi:hypothetical protein